MCEQKPLSLAIDHLIVLEHLRVKQSRYCHESGKLGLVKGLQLD